MTLQFVTPLPPAPTGIAQYSRDLLGAVDGVWRVHVYAEDGFRDPGWSTIRVRGKHRRRAFDPALPTIYQLGNSGYHSFAFAQARRVPGVIVLHDVVLHFGCLGEYLRGGRASEYRREMRLRYGEEGLRFASRVLDGQRPENVVDYPLCEGFVERAAGTIVHSQFARELVLQRVPEARVAHVPMGIPLPALVDRGEARSAIGLPADPFVIASITHVNPFKRLPVVLEALKRALPDVPDALLIVAGSVAPGIDLEGHVSRLGLQRHVRLLGYVSDDQARLIARAADVSINLRYPSAGETSASLLRLMGSGRPVIVTDDASTREYDTPGLIRVAVDDWEEEMLADALVRLAGADAERARLGMAAREYVERHHSMQVAVDGYRTAIAAMLHHEMPAVRNLAVLEPPPRVVPIAGADDPHLAVWESAVVDALCDLRLDRHDDTIVAVAKALVGLRLDCEDAATMDESDVDDTLPIRRELLEILACPACKKEVRLEDSELVCVACKRRYRIEDGIPIMLIEDE